MRQRIFPVPRAWRCQFHWRVHDRASTRSRLGGIPNATFCRKRFSCVLPAGGLATSFGIVHGINFGSVARIDGIAAKFAVGGEQAVLRGKDIADNSEITNLTVMR